MWDLHGPGLEPVSPALAGGFLTTVPPGKPSFRDLSETKSEDDGMCWLFVVAFRMSHRDKLPSTLAQLRGK